MHQAEHLHYILYDLNWLEYSIEEQKMIKLMLMRCQRPSGMNAFKYFYCDLETFHQVW